MDTFKIEGLTFAYPSTGINALDNISLSIKHGEFIAICGQSGCGKSTLLRHLKPDLMPHGQCLGTITFEGVEISTIDKRTQVSKIGYVFQSPDNQIVTDKVWHELAFGLENLGLPQNEIRLRVAEMASFFGIEAWFHKSVTELSGGQKQLLNLASIMAMQPSVLILDEPTSQLDPIAASEFLQTIGKINRELGVSVIITEHRMDEVFSLSDRVLVMDSGKVIAEGSPRDVGHMLRGMRHEMFHAMPVPMRIYSRIDNNLLCPVTVREGRNFLYELTKTKHYNKDIKRKRKLISNTTSPTVEIKEVWFKYDKNLPDVVKGLKLKAYSGELYAIVGGNGTGKTTTLSLISGIRKPYRGNIFLNGIDIGKLPDNDKFKGLLGILPQNPQALFVKKTVESDLYEILSESTLSRQEKQGQVDYVSELCGLEDLLMRHPYDLSGGEQQRAALAKVLLLQPEILILDEPTKGLDSYFKLRLAEILNNLKQQGTTIIMVSHDVDFCANFADRCALFFDGSIVSEGNPQEFFAGNSFYTTSANRMARDLIPLAVTVNDVIEAFGGKQETFDNKKPRKTPKKIEHKNSFISSNDAQVDTGLRKLSKRTIISAMLILLFIPLTIWFGIYYLNDRKYYFISVLVIFEIMIPFLMIFEDRKPQARELVTISVLCAIGVASRMAFFMVPQFKPVTALVIISGVAFGGETGFLVGAIIGFVSNYFFGQGPWTPWQMFSFGIIGFLAGVMFRKGLLRRNRTSLSIFGFITTFIIYGFIMNVASVIMTQAVLTPEVIIISCLRGMPFDFIHAVSTVVFIMLISKPMLEKLDRIKIKYGLVEA